MNKNFRAATVLLALVSLSGCTFGPPLPPYNDPFKNIYNQSSATVPAEVAVRIQHPVAIIVSDNVELYVDWLKKVNEAEHRSIPDQLRNTVAEADTNPNYISARFLQMLKRHFPEAEVVRDFNSAVGAGKKGVALLDIQAVPGARSGDKTTVDATLYFFDAQMNPVSKLSGHGEGTIPFPATTAMVQLSTDAAVQQMDGKIAAFIH